MDSKLKLIKDFFIINGHQVDIDVFRKYVHEYTGANIDKINNSDIEDLQVAKRKSFFLVSKKFNLILEKDLYYSIQEGVPIEENENILNSILILNKIIFKDDLNSIFKAFTNFEFCFKLIVTLNYENNEMLFKKFISDLKTFDHSTDNELFSIIFYNKDFTLRKKLLEKLKHKVDLVTYLIDFLIDYPTDKIFIDSRKMESVSYLFDLILESQNNVNIEQNKAYTFLNNCIVQNMSFFESIEKNNFFNYIYFKKYSEIVNDEIDRLVY